MTQTFVEEFEGGEKQGPVSNGALARSVVDLPNPPDPRNAAPSLNSSLLWFAASYADEIIPFGRDVKLRDRQLRLYAPQETLFASALGIICARNAGFDWKLEGPPRVSARFQDILENADFGRGWMSLITKTSMDLYTQDNGAFWEVVRDGDSETSAPLSINHLDAARCWHTGAPEAPVIYMDRFGKYHILKWFQVIEFAEMPWPVEGQYGVQMCALTRMLRASQILRNIEIYKDEKTSGRHARAIHIVKGITTKQINDAVAEMQVRLDARGQTRYANPLMIGALDPKADVGHDTLELASLPDNFDEEESFKQYIAQIAMAFLTDYQEFAPLPGGNLGTSTQSEIQHMKSRGKGPAIFMNLIQHAINFRILPDSVEFDFDEQDIDAEQAEATVKKTRADERAVRVQSGEITPAAARQLAHDAGDLPEEVFQALGGTDMTPDVTIEGDSQPVAQLGDLNNPQNAPPPGSQPLGAPPIAPPAAPGAPNVPRPNPTGGGIGARIREVFKQKAEEPPAPDSPSERDAVEEDFSGDLDAAFAKVRKNVSRLLRELGD